MDKKITFAIVLMMCLAGCMRSVDDNIGGPWCNSNSDAEGIVNNTGETSEECTTKDTLKNAIQDFVDLIENGPDANITTPVGYTMSVQEVSTTGDIWTYHETTIISPNGFKITTEDNYGNDSKIVDYIVEGTQVQVSVVSDEESTQVRMNNTNTHRDIFDLWFGNIDDSWDGICHAACGQCDGPSAYDCLTCAEADDQLYDQDNDGAGLCVYSIETHWADRAFQLNGSQEHYDQVMNVSLESRESEYHQLRNELGMEDPTAEDYTQYYNPVSVNITGFRTVDDGMVFSGLVNFEGSPFGAIEIYADSSLTVTGFGLTDVEDSRNNVRFNLISGGETVVDMGLQQSAIPFSLDLQEDYEGGGSVEDFGLMYISMYDLNDDNLVTALEISYYSCQLGGFTLEECLDEEIDNETLAIYEFSLRAYDTNMDGYASSDEFVAWFELAAYVGENGGCFDEFTYNLSIAEEDCNGDSQFWEDATESEEEEELEFTGYWVDYETANWSCNWEDTADPDEDYTSYYWSCDDIRDPPEDTGDNDWYYCEYYDDIATHYCTNGFGSQGTDENGEWGNSASFTHWRDGGDPRNVEDDDSDEDDSIMFTVDTLLYGLAGDMNDYNLTFANCVEAGYDDNGDYTKRTCQPDLFSMSIAESEEYGMISYLDNDNSGTISSGDDIIIYLSSFIEIDDATHVRLYSQEADNYNDQNSLLQN
ncbi:MAG: hypothetical protein HON10_05465 [Euryarchaeota archaeon]|nr:hypothetical protein [Euryarchaeota archaeon]MBT7987915.1 hypothetical protein [Euryarchaeota archaeon]